MEQLILTEDDNGKTVTSKIGVPIIVRIEENLTTGYSWAIVEPAPALLELEDTTYNVKASEGTVMAGVGGIRDFTFRATQAGTTEIHLKLWRAWVGDSSIVKRYAVTVQIQS